MNHNQVKFVEAMGFGKKKPTEFTKDFNTNDWISFLNKMREQARFLVMGTKDMDAKDIQKMLDDAEEYASYVREVSDGFYIHCRSVVTDEQWKTIMENLV